MRTIDRYLLWQFVKVFLICFISLAGLYSVIDLFGRLDDFGGKETSAGEIITRAARYYALQSISFFNRTSGILAMIAAMFTVTWIQRHNEMTALLAAGLPRWRVLRPVLLASIVVALVAAGVREGVIPSIRHELALDSKDLSGDRAIPIKPRYDSQSDILLGGEKAILRKEVILKPNFVLPPKFAASFGKQLTAQEATYLPSEGERPAGYLLTGVTLPGAIDTRPTLYRNDGVPAVVTRTAAPWLEPGSLFVVSDLSFELLAAGPQWRDLASTGELIREVKNPSSELGPDVHVAIHTRLVQPILDVTLLMLGLPLVVARGTGSPFLAIGLSVLVVTGFFLMALGGQALGAGGWISPATAAWLPLLLFIPLAAAQSESLRQ